MTRGFAAQCIPADWTGEAPEHTAAKNCETTARRTFSKAAYGNVLHPYSETERWVEFWAKRLTLTVMAERYLLNFTQFIDENVLRAGLRPGAWQMQTRTIPG